MRKALSVLLFALISTNGLAGVPGDGTSTDSDQIGPLDIVGGKNKGFVLANGVCSLYCNGGSGCGCEVSKERCPPGYSPSIATGVVNGGGRSWPIHHIYLQPQPGVLLAFNRGYQVRFTHAFIETTTGSSTIMINHSVYCN